MKYMKQAFSFTHFNNARLGDSVHFHVYRLDEKPSSAQPLQLNERYSTDADGIAQSLGMQISPKVALETIMKLIEAKIKGESTLFVPV